MLRNDTQNTGWDLGLVGDTRGLGVRNDPFFDIIIIRHEAIDTVLVIFILILLIIVAVPSIIVIVIPMAITVPTHSRRRLDAKRLGPPPKPRLHKDRMHRLPELRGGVGVAAVRERETSGDAAVRDGAEKRWAQGV
ncbi:hypothetical protein ONZ43_g7737 [Nemania bipapillata]|uniref:Uncharacterized protein n=1 Tax=Nemania bipapillata TaxID=110536 RepID=A0ACC2HNN8_9PEZI|nr:hypothetical protein ONZ43_g7737 [Nemania bipapillata]